LEDAFTKDRDLPRPRQKRKGEEIFKIARFDPLRQTKEGGSAGGIKGEKKRRRPRTWTGGGKNENNATSGGQRRLGTRKILGDTY